MKFALSIPHSRTRSASLIDLSIIEEFALSIPHSRTRSASLFDLSIIEEFAGVFLIPRRDLHRSRDEICIDLVCHRGIGDGVPHS